MGRRGLGGPEQGRRRELAGDGVQSQWVANEDGERSVDGDKKKDVKRRKILCTISDKEQKVTWSVGELAGDVRSKANLLQTRVNWEIEGR